MNNEERIWKLYKYTCKHNGLIYFGITSKTLQQRWKAGYRENPRLQNTINKYGEDGFIREVVLDNLTKDEACAEEIKHIAEYKATDKNIGFNISIGGTAPMAGRHHTEEAKKKFSETRKGEHNAFYGKHHTEEAKKRMSEQRKGVKHTEEWKLEQSKRSKEWHKTHENPMKGNHRFAGEKNPMFGMTGSKCPSAVSVNQYTLDGQFIQRFGSIVEAANSLGLYNGAHISDVCRGKRKQCKGYIWKYATDVDVHFVDEDCDENEDDE